MLVPGSGLGDREQVKIGMGSGWRFGKDMEVGTTSNYNKRIIASIESINSMFGNWLSLSVRERVQRNLIW